jgi:hypothetical protein
MEFLWVNFRTLTFLTYIHNLPLQINTLSAAKIFYSIKENCQNYFISFLYHASFQHMKWKTNRCHCFNFIHISTDLYMFRATGPSSGEFKQLFTQPLVEWLYRLGRVCCGWSWWLFSVENSHQDQPQHTEHAAWTVQPLNQWLCEQLCEFSW